MRWRLGLVVVGLAAVSVLIVAWVLRASLVNHWLAVHTGTVNEAGPYYAFWSGFGSDLAEFGIIGALATGVYQLVKKYNCHEPGCWRVGTHPAAGGQFLLCYHHHPDYAGKRPTHDMIVRLHQENVERQHAINAKLVQIHRELTGQTPPAQPGPEGSAPAGPGAD
ncbi:MAG TPA: hypothetical protein VK646_13075 [Actinomycetota bacterium]|nr:hypothetical protein [Actinomycetota bacterium]